LKVDGMKKNVKGKGAARKSFGRKRN